MLWGSHLCTQLAGICKRGAILHQDAGDAFLGTMPLLKGIEVGVVIHLSEDDELSMSLELSLLLTLCRGMGCLGQ